MKENALKSSLIMFYYLKYNDIDISDALEYNYDRVCYFYHSQYVYSETQNYSVILQNIKRN